MPTAVQPVLILHNRPRPVTPGSQHYVESDAGVMDQVRSVSEALSRKRVPYRIAGIGSIDELPRILASTPEPVVLNLVEFLPGSPEEFALVPALCSAFGKSATGCDTPCLALGLDKWRSKAMFAAAGVPTPPGALIRRGEKARAAALPKGPWIVKPVSSDASEGIDDQSVVPRFGPRLHAAVQRVHRRFGQDALVESLFGSREFNIGLFEHRGQVRMLPVAEIDFSKFEPGRPRIVDYAAKWLPHTFQYQNTPRVGGIKLPPRVAKALTEACHAAWHALGCRDYARVDVRAEADGRIAVIEVNPNPDITPIAGFACGLRDAGIAYEQFVLTIVENATARLPSPPRRTRGAKPAHGEQGAIRLTRRGDREEIVSFLRATRFFRPHELEVADEVLSEAILKGDAGHYESFCIEMDGRPAGWICYGATPCTQGTYDIYWIAVAPESQRLGFGRRLLEFAERRIAEKGGRIITIETSGRPVYEPTRNFYRKLGYRESACLREFYAPGDDKVVFLKPLYQA